jgi:hypothetical protein
MWSGDGDHADSQKVFYIVGGTRLERIHKRRKSWSGKKLTYILQAESPRVSWSESNELRPEIWSIRPVAPRRKPPLWLISYVWAPARTPPFGLWRWTRWVNWLHLLSTTTAL